VRIFEESQRPADLARDLEDLVFIDSELAKLHNLRGSHSRAAEACRRGSAVFRASAMTSFAFG